MPRKYKKLQIRTDQDRNPFSRRGYYWQCFGHLWANASESFRKRMLSLRDEDETMSMRKSLNSVGNHYPQIRR